MVSDHVNYLTFEDPGAVHTVRRALKLAHAGDLYGAAETAGVDVSHAAVVSEGLRRGMRFSIGAEVDNDPRSRPDAQNIVDAMRPDGIIRTVRFLSIEHPEKGADWPWPFANDEFTHLFDVVGVERTWELYMARLLDDIEKLPGQIVGNFYVPAMFGHWPDEAMLEQYEDQVLDACLARGMAIEINTRFFYRDHPTELKARYRSANERLMRKAKAKGVGIAIGSGAHSPKDQGGAFDIVLHMLDACEINEIVFPVGGRLARVVLRATREHLEAHKNTPEPAQPGSSISGFSRAELGLPEEPERSSASEKSESKTSRSVGSKKRSSGPGRTTKGPESEAPAKPATPRTSRRSADSASSSAKAKTEKIAEPAPPSENVSFVEESAPIVAVTPSPQPESAPEALSAPAKTAKKSTTKTPATKPPAVKPPAKVPAAKPPATKLPAVKASAKPPARKATAVKATAAKAPAKPAKPSRATPKPAPKKATATKSTAKKAPPKKIAARATTKAKTTSKKTPSAKPAPRSTAKKAPAKKSPAKKTTSPAKPVKKSAKTHSKGSTTKKKATTKRR